MEQNIRIKRRTFSVVSLQVPRRKQALKLILTYSSRSRLVIDERSLDTFAFSCLIDRDVCYITLCEKNFPRKNAYAYLEDLAQEFIAQYGQKIQLAARPYSFIEFGLFR